MNLKMSYFPKSSKIVLKIVAPVLEQSLPNVCLALREAIGMARDVLIVMALVTNVLVQHSMNAWAVTSDSLTMEMEPAEDTVLGLSKLLQLACVKRLVNLTSTLSSIMRVVLQVVPRLLFHRLTTMVY